MVNRRVAEEIREKRPIKSRIEAKNSVPAVQIRDAFAPIPSGSGKSKLPSSTRFNLLQPCGIMNALVSTLAIRRLIFCNNALFMSSEFMRR
jgi:hypothetical protein